MANPSDQHVQLSVPARPEFVAVIRAVVGAVASTASLTVDAVDDLRLAVDEACSALLVLPGDSPRLRLEIDPTLEEVRVRVCLEGFIDGWPPERFRETLAWTVITGLTDGADIVEGGEATLEIRKRLPDLAR